MGFAPAGSHIRFAAVRCARAAPLCKPACVRGSDRSANRVTLPFPWAMAPTQRYRAQLSDTPPAHPSRARGRFRRHGQYGHVAHTRGLVPHHLQSLFGRPLTWSGPIHVTADGFAAVPGAFGVMMNCLSQLTKVTADGYLPMVAWRAALPTCFSPAVVALRHPDRCCESVVYNRHLMA